MIEDRRQHWDKVYAEKTESQLSWHQDDPYASLELIDVSGIPPDAAVIDIGAGTSRLAACLIARGMKDITVLDISGIALDNARRQIGEAGNLVTWVEADITRWVPSQRYDLWHDRAVFHFLAELGDRAAYLAALGRALRPGGHVIIATFAPDGPERCSGLPVVRYSPDDLWQVLGSRYQLVSHLRHLHKTPWGSPQSFQFSLFRMTQQE